MVKQWWGDELKDHRTRVNILDAMLNSLELANPESPWITLVTLKEDPEPKDDSLEAFLHDCLNSGDILNQVSKLKVGTGKVVVKFPLPLSGAVARIGSKDDAEVIATTVQQLKELGAEPTVDQFDECQKLLGQVQFPFEGFLLHSLLRLTRWQNQFLLPLA
jgi:hypothetical protein